MKKKNKNNPGNMTFGIPIPFVLMIFVFASTILIHFFGPSGTSENTSSSNNISSSNSNYSPYDKCKDKYGYYISECTSIVDNEEKRSTNKTIETKNNSYASANQEANTYKKQCIELGFKVGNEAYGNCVLRLMELDKPRDNKANITIQNNTNNDAIADEIRRANEIEKNKVLLDISRGLLQKPTATPIRPPVNCRTVKAGNSYQTYCN
jgi:hypothetical protein